jgi:hypothetical protein
MLLIAGKGPICSASSIDFSPVVTRIVTNTKGREECPASPPISEDELPTHELVSGPNGQS